jgi:hypothetical protein
LILSLRIFLICSILVYLLIIIYMLRKKSLNLKYTLLWLFSALVMLIVIIFPNIIYGLSALAGVINPVNMVFVFLGMFSLLILLSLTLIVSHLNNKIRNLTQSNALLEERIRKLESLKQ